MNRLLLCLLSLSSLAYCMNDGDQVEWNRFAYIVKVLSTLPSNETVACTGVMVTPTLVLTSSKCYEGVDEKTLSSVVLSARGGNSTDAWRRKVISMKMEDHFAVISIKPRKTEMSCPSRPAPRRLARLPLSVSLMKSSWAPIDTELLTESKCRIVGFETVEVSDYTTSHILLHTHVTLETELDMMTARVENGRGPCWDDIGLPVECELEEMKWTQVGMLHSITVDQREEEDEDEKQETTCQDITGMRFSLFTKETVGHLLDKMGGAEVFSTYANCLQ